MDGKRVLPAITDEMLDGFMFSGVVIREINHSIMLGVQLGHNCALPNCHAIARVVNKFVKGFEVVDGFIPIIKTKIVNGSAGFGVMPMHHSWLALKSDTKFILDVIPLGSVPPFISPTFLYLDEYSPVYLSHKLPESVSMEEIDRDAEKMFEIIGKSFVQKRKELKSAA